MNKLIKIPFDKRKDTVAILCMACVLLFAATGCEKDIDDDLEARTTDFYYTDEGKIESFSIRKDKVIIKAKSEAEAEALCGQPVFSLAFIVGFDVHSGVSYFWVIGDIDPKKTKLADLMQLPEVADATYGLEYTNGTLHYPQNKVYVKCKDGQSLENVLNECSLSNYVEKTELVNPYSELFLVTLNVKLGDILRISRELYTSGLCKAASPSYFLVMSPSWRH